MGSYDGPTADDIDRDPYVKGDEVAVVEHADTTVGQVAYGATCKTHGDLMNGDWHDMARATKAVQDHLDVFHSLGIVEAVNTIRFLARTWLAPDASEADDVEEAEERAEAAFAALDRFNVEEIAEWIHAQGEDSPFGGDYIVISPDAIGTSQNLG